MFSTINRGQNLRPHNRAGTSPFNSKSSVSNAPHTATPSENVFHEDSDTLFKDDYLENKKQGSQGDASSDGGHQQEDEKQILFLQKAWTVQKEHYGSGIEGKYKFVLRNSDLVGKCKIEAPVTRHTSYTSFSSTSGDFSDCYDTLNKSLRAQVVTKESDAQFMTKVVKSGEINFQTSTFEDNSFLYAQMQIINDTIADVTGKYGTTDLKTLKDDTNFCSEIHQVYTLVVNAERKLSSQYSDYRGKGCKFHQDFRRSLLEYSFAKAGFKHWNDVRDEGQGQSDIEKVLGLHAFSKKSSKHYEVIQEKFESLEGLLSKKIFGETLSADQLDRSIKFYCEAATLYDQNWDEEGFSDTLTALMEKVTCWVKEVAPEVSPCGQQQANEINELLRRANIYRDHLGVNDDTFLTDDSCYYISRNKLFSSGSEVSELADLEATDADDLGSELLLCVVELRKQFVIGIKVELEALNSYLPSGTVKNQLLDIKHIPIGGTEEQKYFKDNEVSALELNEESEIMFDADADINAAVSLREGIVNTICKKIHDLSKDDVSTLDAINQSNVIENLSKLGIEISDGLRFIQGNDEIKERLASALNEIIGSFKSEEENKKIQEVQRILKAIGGLETGELGDEIINKENVMGILNTADIFTNEELNDDQKTVLAEAAEAKRQEELRSAEAKAKGKEEKRKSEEVGRILQEIGGLETGKLGDGIIDKENVMDKLNTAGISTTEELNDSQKTELAEAAEAKRQEELRSTEAKAKVRAEIRKLEEELVKFRELDVDVEDKNEAIKALQEAHQQVFKQSVKDLVVDVNGSAEDVETATAAVAVEIEQLREIAEAKQVERKKREKREKTDALIAEIQGITDFKLGEDLGQVIEKENLIEVLNELLGKEIASDEIDTPCVLEATLEKQKELALSELGERITYFNSLRMTEEEVADICKGSSLLDVEGGELKPPSEGEFADIIDAIKHLEAPSLVGEILFKLRDHHDLIQNYGMVDTFSRKLREKDCYGFNYAPESGFTFPDLKSITKIKKKVVKEILDDVQLLVDFDLQLEKDKLTLEKFEFHADKPLNLHDFHKLTGNTTYFIGDIFPKPQRADAHVGATELRQSVRKARQRRASSNEGSKSEQNGTMHVVMAAAIFKKAKRRREAVKAFANEHNLFKVQTAKPVVQVKTKFIEALESFSKENGFKCGEIKYVDLQLLSLDEEINLKNFKVDVEVFNGLSSCIGYKAELDKLLPFKDIFEKSKGRLKLKGAMKSDLEILVDAKKQLEESIKTLKEIKNSQQRVDELMVKHDGYIPGVLKDRWKAENRKEITSEQFVGVKDFLEKLDKLLTFKTTAEVISDDDINLSIDMRTKHMIWIQDNFDNKFKADLQKEVCDIFGGNYIKMRMFNRFIATCKELSVDIDKLINAFSSGNHKTILSEFIKSYQGKHVVKKIELISSVNMQKVEESLDFLKTEIQNGVKSKCSKLGLNETSFKQLQRDLSSPEHPGLESTSAEIETFKKSFTDPDTASKFGLRNEYNYLVNVLGNSSSLGSFFERYTGLELALQSFDKALVQASDETIKEGIPVVWARCQKSIYAILNMLKDNKNFLDNIKFLAQHTPIDNSEGAALVSLLEALKSNKGLTEGSVSFEHIELLHRLNTFIDRNGFEKIAKKQNKMDSFNWKQAQANFTVRTQRTVQIDPKVIRAFKKFSSRINCSAVEFNNQEARVRFKKYLSLFEDSQYEKVLNELCKFTKKKKDQSETPEVYGNHHMNILKSSLYLLILLEKIIVDPDRVKDLEVSVGGVNLIDDGKLNESFFGELKIGKKLVDIDEERTQRQFQTELYTVVEGLIDE
ncbi:hypothetical protein DID78_04165 [Candidatus Marinamargulisbacteria bacterium SCGC AG-343-D04]|nr:hypothetical protein DID78_04165 [Candidatus Marinamargulisbacteria bacterium SCGC AG-343-D04]